MLTDDWIDAQWDYYMRKDVGGVRAFARAIERETRREALEEALRSLPECGVGRYRYEPALKECGVGHYLYEQALEDCAAAIRALKEKP